MLNTTFSITVSHTAIICITTAITVVTITVVTITVVTITTIIIVAAIIIITIVDISSLCATTGYWLWR